MSVLLCFHAHPDDEVFLTGGVMRRAADAGHRVVLVVATDGARGEYPDGLLAPGESLAARRAKELEESARALGAARVVPFGYGDSGMAGTAGNHDPNAFANADPSEVGARLAAVIEQERADVVTIYDEHGGYGHPDHVQVHRAGIHAERITGHDAVYEASSNRDHLMRLLSALPGTPDDVRPPDLETFGLPESELTTAVDVSMALGAKRAAMIGYESQIGDFGPMLNMPEEHLRAAFGVEWFRRRGVPPGLQETELPL
ncbi:PIG-L deacetylase family protein [Rhodococcus pyridinivorans]|uniref:PIG-L deacetylase family protein n=1 Tax=Rhodococcus pyridinivorans TaxID=103816 RepID=UPI0020789369|nr:PIG-L family deacetylase [Rhodococcus pyridinivorans]USI91739.1 PIG-L family deacetylase [Rhodococcus pyridinivorans]